MTDINEREVFDSTEEAIAAFVANVLGDAAAQDMDASSELTDPDMLALLDQIEQAREKFNKIVIPEALDQDAAYVGPLYGYIRPQSGYHVILGYDGDLPGEALGAQFIGAVCADDQAQAALFADAHERGMSDVIVGRRSEDGLSFTVYSNCAGDYLPGDTPEKSIYTLRQNIFSRNSGLIETSWMDDKCVVISGVGSVGSLIALQLARSGVGRFVLVDTDCMEIHNVCRHQCDLSDVGRYKVDAIAERIQRINPSAQVRTFRKRIQEVPASAYSDWTGPRNSLFIGTCDNRVGNAYACDAAKAVGAPFLALGFQDRAWCGELFVYLPMRKDICYRCAFLKQIEENIAEERRNHLYIGEENRANAQIVPGLDVDIEYGVCLLDKVALDVLNLFNRDYTPRLIRCIGQLNYFAATQDRSADEFYKLLLPQPVCLQPVGLSPEMRRCPSCRGENI